MYIVQGNADTSPPPDSDTVLCKGPLQLLICLIRIAVCSSKATLRVSITLMGLQPVFRHVIVGF